MPAIAADLLAQCLSVESTVNYLDDMDEVPVFYAQKTENNLRLSTHGIRVHDARPVQARLSLDREGFRLVESPTAMVDFRDADEVHPAREGDPVHVFGSRVTLASMEPCPVPREAGMERMDVQVSLHW